MAISVKLLKELSDKVKSEKNSCPDSQATATDLKRRRTHTSPYDNGNQLTFDDGKVIWWALVVPFFNVNFMGIKKFVIVIHGQSL